jgi:hypothetical protein
MRKTYKALVIAMIAVSIVVAIIDVKLCNYKDAFYMMIQAIWLGLFYSALYGWSKSQKLNEQIMQEWDKTTKSLVEAMQREQIAHELIADLRKRLESKN